MVVEFFLLVCDFPGCFRSENLDILSDKEIEGAGFATDSKDENKHYCEPCNSKLLKLNNTK